MITVREADDIILGQTKDFGVEEVAFDGCLGRVLAEEIEADRDLPPFNRVTMDGIAIRFEAIEKGIFSFELAGTQLAGDQPIEIQDYNRCIAIMTGASLSPSLDTVIPVEKVKLFGNHASVERNTNIKRYQNIHFKGKDKKYGEILVSGSRFITPSVVTIAAAVGKSKMLVKKNPKVVIISTGNELVDIQDKPSPFQIRRSNNYALDAVLKQYSVEADMMHLPDDRQVITQNLRDCLQNYDVIILSGGVSMGTSDFVPLALEQLQVRKLFHKIEQRPGKPFWFGCHADGPIVFAFPGNPVSTFMCFYRYFIPWLKGCWQVKPASKYAILDQDVYFEEPLQYFLQVKLLADTNGAWRATPIDANGSGDFVSLVEADAFIELPAEINHFKKGNVYRVWIINQIGS